MNAPGPLATVNQPALDDVPIGTLLSTFEPVATEDDRWEGGYQFSTWGSCLSAFRWGPCSGVYKPEGSGSSIVETRPVLVNTAFKCSTWAFEQGEYEDAAKEALRLMGGQMLEAELWDGLISQQNGWGNRYLADLSSASPADGAGAGPYPWPSALPILQKALRECSGESIGVIHASPAVVGLWLTTEAVYERDGKLRDKLGNFIIAGGGYSGNPSQSQSYSLVEDAGADFTLTVTNPITGDSETTAAIAQGGTAAALVAALEALTIIDAGDVTATGTGTFAIVFAGRFASQAVTMAITGTPVLTATQTGGEVATWGSEYAFATDMIDVRVGTVEILGEDALHEAMRRDINEVELRAEAYMSATWARCCHHYIEVSLSDACTWPTEPIPA
ncbi:MAG TPA: hypothetical protein VMX12_12115 [Acidimicrobiia bacterium]|nr:hypothetical protein [Acidimicrobiia bacterium]